MSLTYNETKKQYQALKQTFEYLENRELEIVNFLKSKQPKSLTFIGSGSSYYLSQSFEIMAKVRMGIQASSIPAGDLMLHYEKYTKQLDETMLVVVSRSGSTSEVLNALNNVKSKQKVTTLSVTCVEDSEISKISDMTLVLPWAFDESVCQTRTVTNLYSSVAQIIGYWSGDSNILNDLKAVTSAGSSFMEKYEKEFKKIANLDWHNVVILADGEIQGIATEAALAFQEISQTSSNYYHLLDSRHGPMVMINRDSLVITCLTSNDFSRQSTLINDVVAKGAKVIVYTSDKVDDISGVMLQISFGMKLDSIANGIPFVNISQLTAYYKAIKKGINPDKPDGLEPWIKL